VEQGPFQAELYTSEVLPGTITGLYASNDGGIWMVSDQGFARLEEGDWDTHLQDLAGQLVWVDKTGRVWAVNEDASEISRWEAGEWTQYGETEGWQPLLAWFAQVGRSETDSRGNLWVSTSQDVRVFDGDSWLIYNNEDMNLPPTEIEDLRQGIVLQVLENDYVWVGICYWGGPGPFGGAGVRWFDGQTWQGADSPTAEGCVTQIEEDGAGNVWVAVEDELWRYKPESEHWSQFRSPEPEEVQRYGFATEMVVHPDGDVWIILAECGGASCFGATVPYRVHNGQWEQFAERSEIGFQRLVLDGTGELWALWEPGISRIEADELTLAADLYTTRYAVDADGRIWIVTGIAAEQVLWAADEH
jgi:ligand-binding sensor domain-containing protein